MYKYQIDTFQDSGNIIIYPAVQDRARYPFTESAAIRFFSNFSGKTFEFDQVVRSIYITDGKENLPKHSYANGWFYAITAEQLFNDIHHGSKEEFKKNIGTIFFEYGGTISVPKIKTKNFKTNFFGVY